MWLVILEESDYEYYRASFYITSSEPEIFDVLEKFGIKGYCNIVKWVRSPDKKENEDVYEIRFLSKKLLLIRIRKVEEGEIQTLEY